MGNSCPRLPAWLVWVLLGLVFLARADHRYFFRNLYLDTQVQLIAARHEASGRGFVTQHPRPEDLAQWDQRSERIFQPAYGRLVAWLVPLAGGDWLRACWWVDLAALALCLLGLHGLAMRLDLIRGPWYVLWLVFWGVSPAPLHYLSQTDLLSLGFFLLAWWAMLARRSEAGAVLVSVLALGAAMAIRGAYLGLVPLLSIGWGLRAWQGATWRPFAGATGGTLLLLGAYLAWQVPQGTYLQPVRPGWYFPNLWQVDAFPIKAYFYYGLPHVQALRAYWPSGPNWIALAGGLASLAIMGGLLAGAWPAWRHLQGQRSPWGRFTALLGITFLLNLAMLAWLSLRWPPENWNWTGYWTFVMETRYYAPTQAGILLGGLWLATWAPHPRLRQGFRLLLLAATMAACTYPLYLKYRIHLRGDQSGTFVTGPDITWLTQVQAVQAQHDRPLVVASPEDLRLGELTGAATIAYDTLLNVTALCASAPVGLLLALPPPAAQGPAERAFLARHSEAAHRRGETDGLWYWEIGP